MKKPSLFHTFGKCIEFSHFPCLNQVLKCKKYLCNHSILTYKMYSKIDSIFRRGLNEWGGPKSITILCVERFDISLEKSVGCLHIPFHFAAASLLQSIQFIIQRARDNRGQASRRQQDGIFILRV